MARSSAKAAAAAENGSGGAAKKKVKVPAVVVSAPSDTEQGSSPSANDAHADSHSDLSPSSSPPAAGARKKSSSSKKKQANGHAESKSKKSGPADDEYHPGFTESGDPFMVPPTTNFVQNFLQPSRWHLISFFTVGFWAVMCWSTLFGTWGMWVHVSVFMFWRFCYNVGLGVLLDKQSKRKVITRWYDRHTRNKSKLLARFLLHIVNKGVPKGTKAVDYPVEFQAWLAYRALVDLVLINDSTNYIMLGIKCFTLPESIGWLEVLQYLVGSFLAIFNYWAKVDAHRCIGDYCWYWGDFFFRKDVQLTFDGIFELFPHPMYTVGYSLYYGYSLICRSYTMLFVSLIAHSMQMLFLFFVEEPHIERTYGNSNPTIDPNQYRVLYDPKTGLFPGRAKKTVFHMNWDYLRRADISLYCLIAYGVMGCVLLDQTLVIVQVVVWRLIHWICLGYSLWAQSHRQQWTRYYTQRGRTLYEAFDNWKRVFHTSLTMNNLVFVGCALRFVEFESWRDLLHPWNAASVALGCTLILFSLWSSYSTFSVVGDFGWFYGDFFIPPESFRPTLVYTGIYRFLNNPDCVVGYAGLYGLALITQSWRVFSLALGSQLLNIIFLNVVEIPHMQKLYQQNTRKDGPLARVVQQHLQRILPEPLKLQPEQTLRVEARRVRLRAIREAYQIYKRIAALNNDHVNQVTPRKMNVSLSCAESVQLGEPITVSYKAPADHPDTDWIGIYEPDVQSVPGHSAGRWQYVPVGPSGSVTFAYEQLPKTSGVFEIRYHTNNNYTVVATVPIQVVEPDSDDEAPSSAPRLARKQTA